MEKTLSKIETLILLGVVFLVPLVFSPLFVNSYVTFKLTILVFGLVLILLLKLFRLMGRGTTRLSVGTFDFPILLLAVSYLVSAIIRTPNKMEAFFLPGSASIILGGTLVYFLINQLKDENKKYVRISLVSSGVVFSLIVLLASVGVFKGFTSLPAFMRDTWFTPLGGSLPGMIFLLSLIPVSVSLIYKEKDIAMKAVYGVSAALISFGLIITLVNSLPGKESSPQLPSFNTSWNVAVDSLKTSPVLGVGPGNYVTAFNRFRPLEYNQTDIWRLRFTSARSMYLTVMTEVGLLGLAAIIILAVQVSRIVRTRGKEFNFDLVALVTFAVLVLLFPSNLALDILLFVLLALVSQTREVSLGFIPSVHRDGMNKIPAILVSIPVLLVLLAFSYFSVRVLSAEYKYRKALVAVARNDGKAAYDILRDTINTNPYVDRYRTSYAQINLALANAIAGKQDLTDDDRNTIGQLIQQAIREGKVTVTLNPQRASNWEVLARIYQTLIPLAQGSDAFAVQTFRQAIALDPINPDLRIALGGVYYGAKDYETAIRVLELAVAAKADLPNAHFNLAFALRENGQIERAIQEMNTVMSLVDQNSQDYQVAKKTLDDLESKRASTPAEGGENLTPPQDNEQVLEPPIELPADAEPPAAGENSTEASSSASPSGSASPSATPLP